MVKKREALLCSTSTSSSPYWIPVFLFGDSVTPQQESRLVDEAWRSHGFFLVENHIVYANLISSVHRYMDTLFYMPLSEKTKSLEENLCALLQCLSFTRRFSSELPWKETLFTIFCKTRLIAHSWRVFPKVIGWKF